MSLMETPTTHDLPRLSYFLAFAYVVPSLYSPAIQTLPVFKARLQA